MSEEAASRQQDQRDHDAAHAARSGLSQIAAMLGQGLIPLHRVLVSRLFGQVAYGIYRAGADLCEVVMRAGMAGADKSMYKFVAAHRAAGETREESEALGTGLRLAGGLSAVLATILALAAPFFVRVWGKREYGTVLPILAPSIVLGAGVMILMAATLAARVTRVNLFVRGIAEPVLLVLTTLVAYALHRSVTSVALAHLSTYLILLPLAIVGASVVFGRRRLGHALGAPRRPGFIGFALPVGASEMLNGILQRANVFILSGFAGASSVAVFAAAEELGRSVVGIRYAFDSIASPLISEALHSGDRDRLRYNLALMTRWVASAAAPIAFTLLALRPELLGLYGPGYHVGTTAITLLVLGHLVNGVMGLTPYVILMSGRSRLFLWDNLGAAALNLALSFVLIPRYGVTGGAIASTVSVVALQGALCVQGYVLERVHPFNWSIAKTFAAATIAFAAELGARAVPLPPLPRVALVIATGAVVYAAALIKIGPGEEERRFVLRLVARITGRTPPP
jgi:O-antigen/teichoic acid export membrane protein